MNKHTKLVASMAFAAVSLCGLAAVVAGVVSDKEPDVQPVMPSVVPSMAPSTTPVHTVQAPPPIPTYEEEEGEEAVVSVHPGSFCSPDGAIGVYRGTTYTCKGPKPYRWRG